MIVNEPTPDTITRSDAIELINKEDLTLARAIIRTQAHITQLQEELHELHEEHRKVGACLAQLHSERNQQGLTNEQLTRWLENIIGECGDVVDDPKEEQP